MFCFASTSVFLGKSKRKEFSNVMRIVWASSNIVDTLFPQIPIDERQPLGSSLQTTLPLKEVLESVRENNCEQVRISQDPGRFLCNYILYVPNGLHLSCVIHSTEDSYFTHISVSGISLFPLYELDTFLFRPIPVPFFTIASQELISLFPHQLPFCQQSRQVWLLANLTIFFALFILLYGSRLLSAHLNMGCRKENHAHHSLFLHVPPEDVVPINQQTKFVLSVMDAITSKLPNTPLSQKPNEEHS